MNKKRRKLVFTIQRYLEPITHSLQSFFFWRNHRVRYGVLFVTSAIIVSQIASILDPFFVQNTYALGKADTLLPEISEPMAKNIKYDASQQLFNFKTGNQAEAGATKATTGNIAATAYKDPAKGVSVTDSTNNVDFKLTPKFKMLEGKQDGNRIIYPLKNGSGWAVYTMQGAGVKEDILLNYAPSDKMTLEYELGLGDGLIARVEKDGGIGVYGNKLFSSNISAGTTKDAELLQKARKKATKDTLLFSIPRPVVNESYKEDGVKQTNVSAAYELKGKSLKVNVTGLKAGVYPLSIDPSIYVVTASQFMYGNNETNINFDVTNKLIKKGRTTGARFDSWANTANLPTGAWAGGTAASGGFLYQVGGASFSGQVYSSQGAGTFSVPSGVTSVTVKMWGGGGGAGSGGTSSTGGAGGGAGFVEATLSTTPGENLSVYVGGGGGAGTPKASSSGGGGGGGHSSVYRSSTALAIAGGGAGGGGGHNTSGNHGGAGGAGGGTTGVNGTTVADHGGGSGGTSSAGGAGGTGHCGGSSANGASLAGGDGGNSGFIGSCSYGTGGAGGLATGGGGGTSYTVFANSPGGGGGGSGYYGGGGGAGGNGDNGSGGGGGGSSYTDAGATSVTNTAGSGTVPGNSSDINRGNAGNGGTCSGNNCTGTAGNTGLVIISYSGGGTATSTVNWAKFDTSDGTIINANPGNGTCSGWCTTSAYSLPDERANFSLVAYNGYLYAMGGHDDAFVKKDTIYVAKLGANGEPRLWHPTDSNKTNWVYWYHDDTNMKLSSVRINAAAVAYNNRMYFIGGVDSSAPVSTVQIADILPNGKLGSWSSSTAYGSNVYGHTAQVYNDRLYVLGGAATVGGSPVATVYYNKINSDGTLNNWVQTSSFTTGRTSGGGRMAVVWGGYIYISGGCSAMNGSGYCTNVLSDTQVASINADGSLDAWTTISNVSNQNMGFGMIAWRDNIYQVGGCGGQNTTTGDCLTSIKDGIDYATIVQDGEVSTTSSSVASGTAPCSGSTPTSCNLPGTGSVGNLLSAAIITNGFLYVIGGCTNNGCTSTSGGVAFTGISATGDTVRPSSCPLTSTATNGWCVMTATITGGLAAAHPVVFKSTLYLVGGFTGSALKNAINRATLNADGTVGTWTSQSLTSVSATSVSYAYAYTRANPASAGSNPGNLYIFGGCTTSGIGSACSAYTDAVYKCNITTAGAVASCSTTSQLQIGTPTGASGAGLAMAGGTVYANYIYLIGGTAPGIAEIATVRYAKFDNSNNVVTVGSGWTESGQQLSVSRRNAAAFGYNGYLYVVGGYDSTTGIRSDINYIKLNTSDGSLSTDGFHTSVVTITGRWGLTVPVSNGNAYVIGGCTTGAAPSSCSARTDVVQDFRVYNNNSGGPAGFTTDDEISTSTIGASATVMNGYIYQAGGCTNIACSADTTAVYYAQINADGTLPAWSTGGSMPDGLSWGKLVGIGGTLYYVGGQTGNPASTASALVYYTSSISSGNPTWNGSAATRGIGDAGAGGGAIKRTQPGVAVWNDRIYVVGGTDHNNNTVDTVYISPQQSSGGDITGNWTTSTAINVARRGASVVAYANNLYLIGGDDGTNYLSDVQYAKIDKTNGTVGSWTYTTSLPGPITDANVFAANGYVYLIGGRSASTTCVPNTLVAPISANTTIATGDNPTGIGEWSESNQKYVGDRYGASIAYYDGTAYVLGGGCSSLVGTPQRTYRTTVLSQPQVAKYSIPFDTDSEVYPSHWLVNGLDNSIGARWQLKYRSMTDPNAGAGPGTNCSAAAMSNWGQETNFGNITLGLPGVYTPKDGSGTNTNCARYFYFNLTIDATQAFGYPDDVSRGPTITDLTLRYTADPSKRLMHGRTFIGGLQQPIDTPYYTN